MIKNILLGLLLIFFFNLNGKAYNYINLTDPHNWSGYGNPQFSEAILSVKPNGLFIEYGLYLTIADSSHIFADTTQLEVNMGFDLPQGSFVNDSWLWVNDSIVQAKIMDLWTAYSIYEGIVKRRRDPSILTKSGDQYNLRIYPLMGNASRKIKITYQVPLKWKNNGTVDISLPTNILNMVNKTSNLKILFYKDKLFKNFSIPQIPDLIPQSEKNDGKDVLMATIPASVVKSGVDMIINSPLDKGIFCSTQTKNGEKYYELVLKPDEALGIKDNRKILILLDISKYFFQSTYKCIETEKISYANYIDNFGNYVYSYYDRCNKWTYPVIRYQSNFNYDQFMTDLKKALSFNLTNNDSFNVILNVGNEIKRISESWLSPENTNIEEVFDMVKGLNYKNDTSRIDSLLMNAADFLNTNGKDGICLLYTNTSYFRSDSISNIVLDKLRNKMQAYSPIHIYSMGNPSYIYGNSYYNINYNFFNTLAKFTRGSYNQYYYSEFNNISNSISNISTPLKNIDLFVFPDSGYTYSKYLVNSDQIYASSSIIQLGKYKGNAPLNVIITAEYGDSIIYKSLRLEVDPDDEIHAYDISKIWTAMRLNFMEKEPYSNAKVQEMIRYSIENRVLSNYTAFLCLEPSDTITVCKDCEKKDESDMFQDYVEGKFELNAGSNNTAAVKVEEIKTSDATLSLYPNPFIETAVIGINDVENDAQNSNIEIYDFLGQLIKVLSVNISSGSAEILWDGTDSSGRAVSDGIYLIRYKDKIVKIIKK